MEDKRTDLMVILDAIRKLEIVKDGGVIVVKGYLNSGSSDYIPVSEFGSTPEEAVTKLADKCKEYSAIKGGYLTAKS